MQDAIYDKLMTAVEQMSAFPRSVEQVLKMTADVSCTQRELVDVIKRDPVFTLKILRLVNSPYFGLSREITSIHHASVYLGLNTLKSVALGLAAVGAMPKNNAAGLDMGGFWLHSLAVASATRLLGAMLGVSRDEVADYFTAGLLHDIGKVVFALYMPDEFRKIDDGLGESWEYVSDGEMEVIGATHSQMGALLAEKWHLPKEFCDVIARHHEPEKGTPSQLVDCVFVANQISKKLAYGTGGDYKVSPLPDSVKERFNADLLDLIDEMLTLDEDVENARVFIKLGEEG